MRKSPLAKGVGGINRAETGQVINWSDSLINTPDAIREKIVYSKGDTPLYRIAILIDNGAKAVLLEKGGRNYHPLILLSDAIVPGIAGIGEVNLAGKVVTVDSGEGVVYEGRAELKKRVGVTEEDKEIKVPRIKSKVYVNVGYPTALEVAAKTGADGVGLLRTEFTAVRTLSRLLTKKIFKGMTVKQLTEKSNEADIIYAMAKHKDLKKHMKSDLVTTVTGAINWFGEREVIIRTFDLARDEDDPLGNRGIRRCIAEGGHSLRVLAEAIKESLAAGEGNHKLGIILPLVSHYSQIETALEIILDTGLTLDRRENDSKARIRFGWEIEQPAASQNNEIWLEAFTREYGEPPHFIGIGTNDLTQFTIALGRDVYSREKEPKVKEYLRQLYDEKDFSVIKQIYEISRQCRGIGTRLFLLGEAAANLEYAKLILSFGIVPSVSIGSVRKIRHLAYEFERKQTPKEVIEKYVDSLCKKYPSQASNSLRLQLLKTFGVKR